MSLQVWLPLNGNLDNQGLSDVTVTNSGASVDNNGKIGKCYYFNGSSRISCSSLTVSYPMSISGWFKPTDFTNANIQYWISYNTGSGGTAGHAIGIGTYSGLLGIWFGGTNVTISNSGITNNNWYHIAVTIDSNKKVIVYLNGVQIATNTFTSNHPGSTWLTLGARSNSATGGAGGALYYYKGYMNDARFYDHALSAKEVKELSKGLVLHYPLSQGSTNLYDFESIANKWTAVGVTLANYNDDSYGNVLKVTVGSSLTSEHRIYRNVSNIWKIDQVYTVSFLAKASKVVNCTMSRSIANFTNSFTLTTEWKRYVGKITSTATADTGTLSFQINTTSCDVYITQIKLEYGDIATPYTPGEGDSHYSAMGYDSTTEYDVSGYNNHGTKNGTITCKSDSARYSVAFHFINGSYIMANKNSPDYLPKDSITVNLWIRCTTWGNPISCTEGGGFNFETSNSGVGFVVYLNDVGYKNAYGISGSSLLDGKWHMLTGVYDRINQTVNTYLDAQLMKTTATGSSAVIGYASNRLIISGEAQSTTPVSSTFVGEESDVRIYATALSADDVKQLYNTAAALCNNGTLMAYSFNES